MALDPRIEAVRAKYDLARDDFWQIKQNGQWVCKHAALEIVAVKSSIKWMPPQIIEADAPNLVTSMVVTGQMGDRTEWATGETNASNYSIKGKQPAYPWAMSEKRAKDRVILKLVGIHGLVYSEDEADDFKVPPAQAPAEVPSPANDKPKSSAQLKRDGEWERVTKAVADEMLDVNTFAQFEKVKEHWREEARKSGWNSPFMFQLRDLFDGYEDELSKKIELENARTSPLMAGE